MNPSPPINLFYVYNINVPSLRIVSSLYYHRIRLSCLSPILCLVYKSIGLYSQYFFYRYTYQQALDCPSGSCNYSLSIRRPPFAGVRRRSSLFAFFHRIVATSLVVAPVFLIYIPY